MYSHKEVMHQHNVRMLTKHEISTQILERWTREAYSADMFFNLLHVYPVQKLVE